MMRRLNDLITTDDRMDSVMLPLRDGITITRKRLEPASTEGFPAGS